MAKQPTARLVEEAPGEWSLLVGRHRVSAFWPTSKALDHACEHGTPMAWLSGNVT